jgi:hypothetical protein
MIGIYEKAFGEISPEVADYGRFRRLGTTLSMENESWPSSRAASDYTLPNAQWGGGVVHMLDLSAVAITVKTCSLFVYNSSI